MRKAKPVSLSARYTPFVEWSDEDQYYIGRCPELFHGGIHGSERTAVYVELCEALEERVEIFPRDGKELPAALEGKKFSGKFVLRCEPELHKLLTLRALADRASLNAYCVKKLAQA